MFWIGGDTRYTLIKGISARMPVAYWKALLEFDWFKLSSLTGIEIGALTNSLLLSKVSSG